MAGPQDPPSAASRSSGPWLAVAGALVVVVAVVVFVARAGQRGEPAAEEPALTNIMISSEPAGATVTRADGGVLGTTPFEVSLPKSNSELPVIVTRDGYQTRRVTVPLFSASGRIDVMMTKVGEEPPPPPKPLPKDWQP